MAIDDYEGEPVVSGTWFYSGSLPQRITIIARNYDMNYSMFAAEDALLDGEQPIPLGPDGRLYYVGYTSSPGHPTLEEAKAWADSQPWGPVTWDA